MTVKNGFGMFRDFHLFSSRYLGPTNRNIRNAVDLFILRVSFTYWQRLSYHGERLTYSSIA